MTGFTSFDDYLALSRITGLTSSLDGSRLVATVADLNDDGDKFVSALWEIDPAGAAAPRRLTRSDEGESAPAFHPDGSVLFVSKRGGEEDDPPALWRLPAAGEAERLLTRPGGVATVQVARTAGSVVLSTTALPGSVGADEDEKRRKGRK
ncbi:MAG: TolB family protein, partial [Jatrophihabitantaceae bacterium]